MNKPKATSHLALNTARVKVHEKIRAPSVCKWPHIKHASIVHDVDVLAAVLQPPEHRKKKNTQDVRVAKKEIVMVINVPIPLDTANAQTSSGTSCITTAAGVFKAIPVRHQCMPLKIRVILSCLTKLMRLSKSLCEPQGRG